MSRNVIMKPLGFVAVPSQALFGPKAAAKFLGISIDTLKKKTDLGEIPVYEFDGRRAWKWHDLQALIDSLPEWENRSGEKPAKVEEVS